MGFQDTLAGVCSPLSIKIDIDPARMVPGPHMAPQGGSIVDRDHKYCDEPDAMGKLLQDIMEKMGMCKPEACDLGGEAKPKPAGKPSFDGKEPDDDDGGNPFAKNRVKK